MNARSKVLAPVVTVVAVVAVAVTASLVSGGSHGSASPKVLHLAGGGAAEDLAAPAAARSMSSAGGDYQLVGSLPSGTPDDAPAWNLAGGAGAREVARLADALGEPAPVGAKGGWTAGGLHVGAETGQAWWWSPCAVAYDGGVSPDTAVSSSPVGRAMPCPAYVEGSGSTSSGTVTSGSGTAGSTAEAPRPVQSAPASSPGSGVEPAAPPQPVPAPPVTLSPRCPSVDPAPAGSCAPPESLPAPPTPTSAEVFAAAGEVLSAVGLGDLSGHVETYPGGGSVVVDPPVNGLPTVGWSTVVDVAVPSATSAARITSARGWLAPAQRADSYPLIGAPAAFDALPPMPRMMMACPMPSPGPGAPEPSCPEPQPQQITGAHLGLALTWLEDQQLALLPAWLFEVKGNSQPLASLAIERTYLDDGSAPTDPALTDPGAIEPAPDGYVPPPVEPAGPVEDLALQAWQPSKADNAVTVLYENGGCGRTGVYADVKEDDRRVYVLLHADVPPKDRACPRVSTSAPYDVALQRPLGDREIVDLTTDRPVPRA